MPFRDFADMKYQASFVRFDADDDRIHSNIIPAERIFELIAETYSARARCHSVISVSGASAMVVPF